MQRFLIIVSCLVGAAAVCGCGARSGVSSSNSPPPSTVSDDKPLVFVEPATEGVEFETMGASMNLFTRGNSNVWAFRVQGGPVLIHVALHLDSRGDGSIERRTAWHSETVWPEASSVENDSSEQPRYTFSRFPGHVVIQSDSLHSVVAHFPSARRDGEGITRGEGIQHLPAYFPRSLEEVRVMRSYAMDDLNASESHAAGFKRLQSRDITRGILNLRSPLKIGDSVELFEEWPLSNWGPDDSPLVLVVTATRLDLPNEFDKPSLQTQIDLLRGKIDATPTDCSSRLMLAICLETLTAVEPIDHAELLLRREEATDNMREAVAQQPFHSVYRDRLRRELINLGYAISVGTDYAKVPALMDEMLRLQPGFDGYSDASLLVDRCVPAVRKDATIPDADKNERQQQYSRLALDYLRRGLQFELDHGGIELLSRRHRWLAAEGSSGTVRNPALQVEFETSRSVIEKNIARLSVELEQHPSNGEPCYLLAAAHDMLARMSAGEYLPAETAAREQHERDAMEFARQAVARESDNEVYRRRLRRQLLQHAGTTAWRETNSAATPQLVHEALQYEPQLVDFIEGADCIWRADLYINNDKETEEAEKAEVSVALRAEFVAVLSAGIEWTREHRGDDYEWLIKQLPAAIASGAAEWPEVMQLFNRAAAADVKE